MYIIYGGSFNPPTNAHFNIVMKLLSEFTNSKVIVLPVGNKYSKDELINFNHRYNMLKLLFNNNSNIIVSDLENSDKFLGTRWALNYFKQKYNDVRFVIGSDNIIELDTWINYEKLISENKFIIIRRNNEDIDLLMSRYNHLNPNYITIDINLSGSSSLVRQDLEKYKSLIDNKVYNYILENKFYRSD